MAFDDDYNSALTEFLLLCDSLPLDRAAVAAHLRYPRTDKSGLIGSQVGSEIWESIESQRLLSVLLSDPTLARWHGGARSISEVQRRIASFVERWHRLPSVTSAEISRDWSAELLNDLRTEVPTVERYAILFGVSIPEYVDLGNGVALRPIDADGLRELISKDGITELDWLRLPSQPMFVAIINLAADRRVWGPFAATHAMAWGFIEVEQVRWLIWLTTGTVPRRGHQFVLEPSSFAVYPIERESPSLMDLHRPSSPRTTEVDIKLLKDISVRLNLLRGEAFAEESTQELRLLERYMRLSIDSADPILLLLLTYAALDGYLRRRRELDTVLPPRLAVLIGEDMREERAIRAIVTAWYRLRSQVGHGEQPDGKDVNGFLKGLAPIADDGQTWSDSHSNDALIRRSALLFRRAFLALLWCTISPGVTEPELLLIRDELLANLDRARADATESRRISSVPGFVRAMGLG